MAVDTALGTTLTFGTTTGLNALKLMSVTVNGITCEDVRTSHMGTTGTHTYQASDLIEGGEVEAVFQYDATVNVPLKVSETITINPGGQGSGSKISFSGYIKSKSVPFEFDNTGLILQTITMKVAGAVTEQGS